MKRILIPLIVSLSFSVPFFNAAWWSFSPDCSKKEYSTKVLTARSKPGIVMIFTDKTSGSGFVVRHIKNKTLILTNSHVIKAAKTITVEWADGNQDKAQIVLDGGAKTTLTDLALLEVSGLEGRVLPLKKEQAEVGREVIAIGAPRGLGFSLTKGIISSLRNAGTIVQTDTAINPGSSGGPLINTSGCVVGINTLGITKDVGLNFAISSQTAKRFVDKYESKSNQNNYQSNEAIDNRKSKSESESNDNNEKAHKKSKDHINRIKEIARIPGKNREVINLANIALALKESALGYSYRGYAKAGLEDYQGAINDFTKAVELWPVDFKSKSKTKLYRRTLARIHTSRGRAKIFLEDFEGAINDFTKVIKLKSTEEMVKSKAYNLRGIAKAELEDYEGAINDFTKAIGIKPADNKSITGSYLNRAIAKMKSGDYEGTISDFTKAIKLDPYNKDNYVRRGLAKEEMKDYAGAISDYTKAIKLDPNNIRTYVNRAMAKELIKDESGACSDFRNAYRLGFSQAKNLMRRSCK
ncbi:MULTISPECIES: trypsin-like peptidase domain-containing protein [unclassified Prochlorococcus]|uniref:trypsin-like peptidase domain-containing protein n=1 Tax=unclassified Prochlorococcus TaxID=2627481 RepID=UPI0005339EC5|nr:MULTISPECIES: trypsin-like peptidase domain-containing protein [unclassified Prochlorococcus]KGG14985.1 TPR repeat [Prochlorococcus sp. MIT 0602]KGG17177.1 TPR repeat [Prochlorococcus sp. MIT 0603]